MAEIEELRGGGGIHGVEKLPLDGGDDAKVLAILIGFHAADDNLLARGIDKRDHRGAVALVGINEVPERIAGAPAGDVDDARLAQRGFFA